VLAVVWRELGRVVGGGLAAEAAEVMLRLGFDDLGLQPHHRPLRTPEPLIGGPVERLGMRREAHFVHNEIFKGQWGEEFVYAMIEHEWQGARRAPPDGDVVTYPQSRSLERVSSANR
jgi:hypothetical protein